MTLELFISLAGTVVSLIVTTITFFAKYLKNKKAKAIAENVVEIGNAILPLISQAENFVNAPNMQNIIISVLLTHI